MKINEFNCPICLECNTQEYSQDKFRSYSICNVCGLIFVPRSELISTQDERARYGHHQNESEDPAYFNYLSKIVNDCIPSLKPGDEGLDFGCGPSPLMAKIFSSRGFTADSYDLYFHPHLPYKNKTYDFIILSEVIEHLRNPIEVMKELGHLLNVNGKFFIKTKFYPEKELFHHWFYKRDSTHIQFFNEEAFKHLASILKVKYEGRIGEDLYLFERKLDS